MSTLAIALCAQRPVTPIQKAVIELVEELASRVLAPTATVAAPRDDVSRARAPAPSRAGRRS